MKTFKTSQEKAVGQSIAKIFNRSSDSTETKLETFPRYVRRQHLKRFLAFYELFKLVLPLKGSVVECGVFRGFGLMSWAKLSALLEPENLTRRIYGFDTFAGFPSLSRKDKNENTRTFRGDLKSNSLDELTELIRLYDLDRFLGHIPKVTLVKGDIAKTVPRFIRNNPHILVSLLFIDCDLFRPTEVALKTFLPRMKKGSILAFDELDNPQWPGETLAMLKVMADRQYKIQRFDWDPYIGYIIL